MPYTLMFCLPGMKWLIASLHEVAARADSKQRLFVLASGAALKRLHYCALREENTGYIKIGWWVFFFFLSIQLS